MDTLEGKAFSATANKGQTRINLTLVKNNISDYTNLTLNKQGIFGMNQMEYVTRRFGVIEGDLGNIASLRYNEKKLIVSSNLNCLPLGGTYYDFVTKNPVSGEDVKVRVCNLFDNGP